MTSRMLPLQNGDPDLEIKEHQRIVFHIAETVQNGLTTIVKRHIILFVRVTSVSKIQATM